MNNKFKRALSSILAFIMLCSCVCVMNVSSVWAADGETLYYTVDNFFTNGTLDYNEKTTPSSLPTGFAITSSTKTFKYQSFGTRSSDVKNENNNTTGKSFTSELVALGGRTITYTPTETGKLNVYGYAKQTSNSATIGNNTYPTEDGVNKVYVASVPCSATNVATISLTTNAVLLAFEFVPGAVVMDDEYTITGDLGASNELTSGTFTLTNSDNSTTLSATISNGAYTVTKSVSGGSDAPFKVGDKFTVSANGYSASPNEITLAAGSDEFNFTADELTFTSTALKGITLASSLSADELTAGDITSETKINGFTLIADSSNNMTVSAGSDTANGISISKRIQTSGSGSTTKRAIKFTTTEADTNLYIWALSANTSQDRTLTIANDNGTAVGSIDAPKSGKPIPGGLVNLSSVGNYYVYSPNSGVNIYLIGTDKPIAADSTEESSSTDINLDFRTNDGSYATDGTYYITNDSVSTEASDDYVVKITDVKYHGTTYGLVSTNSSSLPIIELKNVVGPAKISLGTADYAGEFSFSSTDTSAKFLSSSGVAGTVYNTIGTKGSTIDIYYTGTTTATITLTATTGLKNSSGTISEIGQVYIPTLAVKTITAEEVPKEVQANSNVKITVSNTNNGDVLVITDSSNAEYKATISSGIADFTGKAIYVGNATLSAEGYTLDPATITIATDTNEYTVTATPTATEVIADGSDTSVLYAGYVAKDGYKVYNTVQAAVDAALSTGATIKLAPKTFTETVVVNKPNIKLIGTARDTSVITYNDSETKNDTYFHGATLAVLADGFSAENLTVQNTAEEDGTAGGKNATALSMDYNNLTATVTITNCNLLAFRDTVYTGKTNANVTLTLDNCLITGFQDVICGSGNVTIKDCTMDTSRAVNSTISNGTARLFAPRGYSDTSKTTVYKAENLTIKSTDSKTNTIYFARAWDGYTLDGTTKVWDGNNNVQVIVDGYTVDSSASSAFDGDTLYGFEANGINCTGITKNYFWLVRKTNGTGNYNTTLASINETPVNTFNALVDEGSNVYRFIGIINSALVEDTNVSSVGFAVTYGDKTVNMSDSIVYTEDNSTYYTVNFAENVSTSIATTLKPYVNYKGYDIEGGIDTQAKTIDYSADVSTADNSAS